jgi:hypothetical protein
MVAGPLVATVTGGKSGTTNKRRTSMKKALWFSEGERPTAEQLAGINQLDFELEEVNRGTLLGGRALLNDNCVAELLKDLQRMATFHGAVACFGVFPVSLRNVMFENSKLGVENGITCFEAWTVRRRTWFPGAAAFEHAGWVAVGILTKG